MTQVSRMTSDPAAPSGSSLAAAPAPSQLGAARGPASPRATRALATAAAAWFVVAVLGQLVFAAYVLAFYGGAAATGQFERWNKVLPHGYVAGDLMGNLVVVLHLALAVVVMAGGALQLVPAVRRRWPRFHRWNGRVYLASVLVVALGGMIMKTTRGSGGAMWQDLGISLNALLIVVFAALAITYARARRLAAHRRWALRLFLAASGVWFFRIGLMFWIVVNRGPAGFDPRTFRGPTLSVLAFAQYALPLLVLELYFLAQQRGGPRAKAAMSAGLIAAALVTAAGSVAATRMLWAPRF
jgi:uncharacterized membrane protein